MANKTYKQNFPALTFNQKDLNQKLFTAILLHIDKLEFTCH